MALAIIAVVHPLRVPGIVVLSVGAVVIALTSVRFEGLCAYQWADVHWRFRARRAGYAKAATGRGSDPLGVALPGLRVTRHVDRAGNRAGVAKLADSWVSVVRLAPVLSIDPKPLLTVLRAAYERTDIRLHSAELVTWSVPSPPRARYYGDHRDTQPMQIHWLALRYKPAEAPIAALARGGGDTGAARTAASAAMALVSRLADTGHYGVVLDEPELRQELSVALGALGGAEARIRETWRDWSISTLRQVCFTPRDARGQLSVLGRWVTGAAFTCTAHTLRRDARGRVRGNTVVRVGIHPTERRLDARQVGKALGAPLLHRNGRQDQSVRESLPLALPVK